MGKPRIVTQPKVDPSRRISLAARGKAAAAGYRYTDKLLLLLLASLCVSPPRARSEGTILLTVQVYAGGSPTGDSVRRFSGPALRPLSRSLS